MESVGHVKRAYLRDSEGGCWVWRDPPNAYPWIWYAVRNGQAPEVWYDTALESYVWPEIEPLYHYDEDGDPLRIFYAVAEHRQQGPRPPPRQHDLTPTTMPRTMVPMLPGHLVSATSSPAAGAWEVELSYRQYDVCQRTQALTLMALGMPAVRVQGTIGVAAQACRELWEEARQRGFDPKRDIRVVRAYVEDVVEVILPQGNGEERRRRWW